MAIQYFCGNERRKRDVLNHPQLNGIDYLEVVDRPEPEPGLKQGRILLYFLNSLSIDQVDAAHVRIEGGQRVQHIGIRDWEVEGNLLRINLDNYGDFSTYRLSITASTGTERVPDWLDPVLSRVDFSFKVACPSDFDCAPEQDCPDPVVSEPEIDYLAKDYASFRQLMLDRLTATVPRWQERNPADLGVTAVEILAYAADHLSYYQDAVATEAYLNTARRRVSVRRHARLLDYSMHDGNNARAWLALEVGDGADGHTLRSHTPFFTGQPVRVVVRDTGLETVTTQLQRHVTVPELDCFALLAVEKLVLADKVHIFHGHIGVNSAAGEYECHDDHGHDGGHGHDDHDDDDHDDDDHDDDDHDDDDHDDDDHDDDHKPSWSLVLGDYGHLNDEGFGLFADRIHLGDKIKVQDIYYNHVNDLDGVQGRKESPLSLPLLTGLPQAPAFDTGDHDVVVNKNRERTLGPGDYKKLRVYSGAKLKLSGGIYNFYAWDIREKAHITLEADCEIRIHAFLRTEEKVHINHNGNDGDEGKARLLIYVRDEDHDDDNDDDEHTAVHFGENNHIAVRLYAADTRIKIEEKTHVVGTLLGRCIKAEENSKFWLSKELDKHCQVGQPGGGEQVTGRYCISELEGDVSVFESMHALTLQQSRNRIEFYTWGELSCCLPRGATRASLDNHDGSLDELRPGELLLFEEVAGIKGIVADADPEHRHVVRLTSVEFVTDPLYEDRKVVNIGWCEDDALPFPLCLHIVEIDQPEPGLGEEGLQEDGSLVRSMSLARGNILLADHGRSICGEPLVPPEVPAYGRYRPRLAETGITFRVAHTQEQLAELPTSSLIQQDPRQALPAVELSEDGEDIWLARRDLLNSDRFAYEFVTETEDDGRAFIRFGDNILGRRPMTGSHFTATYRVGNGPEGNVGAESITWLALPEGESSVQDAIQVCNPLPATGGRDDESIEDVKLYAPQAFRSQKRTVTLADYAEMAQSHPEVQKAEASQRWTGSWYTVFLTIDRKQGRPVDAAFEQELRAYLEPLRTMGHELEVTAPRLAALDIALRVCVDATYLRSEVKAALFEVFSSGSLKDGRPGFFHPDNWTFGQSVYVSTVIETAMAVPGVNWVEVQRFQRWSHLTVVQTDPQSSNKPDIPAEIPMARLEIARLDNDPNAPENGRIEFNMEGGL